MKYLIFILLPFFAWYFSRDLQKLKKNLDGLTIAELDDRRKELQRKTLLIFGVGLVFLLLWVFIFFRV
jgi:hypothetical protein